MNANTIPITAATGVAVLNVEGDNTAVVQLRGGTVAATGVSVTFEATIDGETWFSILGGRANSNQAETSLASVSLAVGAGYSTAHRFNVAQFKALRVRGTALTAGNYVVNMRSDVAAFDSVPVQIPTANPSPTGVAVVDPSTASTNLAVLRNTASDLYELTVSNPTATPAFVKLYDKSSAPVLATDTPVLTIPVAATAVEQMSFGFLGKRFASGIAVAITGGAAATDTTNAPAGVVLHLTRG